MKILTLLFLTFFFAACTNTRSSTDQVSGNTVEENLSELPEINDEDILALLETRNISYSLVRNLMPLLNPYMNDYEINRHDFEKVIFELLILLNSKEKDLYAAEFLYEIAKSVSDRCGKEMTNLALIIREFNDCYALNLPLKANT